MYDFLYSVHFNKFCIAASRIMLPLPAIAYILIINLAYIYNNKTQVSTSILSKNEQQKFVF